LELLARTVRRQNQRWCGEQRKQREQRINRQHHCEHASDQNDAGEQRRQHLDEHILGSINVTRHSRGKVTHSMLAVIAQ
jgi:hypothetical protein